MMPSEAKEERSAQPIWPVFAVILVLGLLMLLPFREKPTEKGRRVACLSYEKQILIAIAMYADDNHGRCPMDSSNPTLVRSMQLLSNMIPAKILHCPDDHRPGARPEDDFKKLTTLNISYSYVPNLKWRDVPDSPVIADRIYTTAKGSRWPDSGNHGTNGGNVGFIDGHVAWYDRLPAALKDKDGKGIVLSP
jgi:prepilin-type processing-associated H-X9-DG protein